MVVKLRRETKGRKGKGVTVVYDLPRNPEFLNQLATELKKACACGGAVGETSVEV
ncbi:MAG: translation initiation factor [Thermoanaerobaculia bacterium]|nr:translation initiation factor [Thermoanaerobaculia bacterium]